MNSSTFFPAQFLSAAGPTTFATTLYEGNPPSSSCPDGFLAPQFPTWSHTQVGWSCRDLQSALAISDIEFYRTFLSGELAYVEAESYTDSPIYTGPIPALTHDIPYEAPIHPPPLVHGHAFSTQHPTFNSSTPQPSHQPPRTLSASCMVPTLIESPTFLECDLSLSDPQTSGYAISQNGRRLRNSHRADICAGSDSSSPSPYPSPSPGPYPRASSELIACRRRNAPAFSSTATSSNRWKCPHCPYVQRNRRSPDLKRHVETHTRDPHVAAWVCCGVPAENAIDLGVPSEVVRDAPLFDFDGVTMIGGCRKVFSRRDALMRHLRRRKGACYGDAGALHQPGNRLVMSS